MSGQPGYQSFADARVQTFGPESEDGHACEKFLLRGIGTSPNGDTVAEFVIKTPQVKCLTHGVIFIALAQSLTTAPMDTDSNDATKSYRWGGLLWLVERTRARSGGRYYLPTRTITGSRSAPTAIPQSPELWGFTFEVQTAGEEIYGRLTVPKADPTGNDTTNFTAAPQGADWKASVRYQSTVLMTDAEWARVRSGAGVDNITPEGIFLV